MFRWSGELVLHFKFGWGARAKGSGGIAMNAMNVAKIFMKVFMTTLFMTISLAKIFVSISMESKLTKVWLRMIMFAY